LHERWPLTYNRQSINTCELASQKGSRLPEMLQQDRLLTRIKREAAVEAAVVLRTHYVGCMYTVPTFMHLLLHNLMLCNKLLISAANVLQAAG